MAFELANVHGTPETRLSDAFAAGLPENEAPAPWTVRASAVVWWSTATPAATDALPASLRDEARSAMVVGGLVRYADTPVGTYDEVFGAVGLWLGRGLGRRFAATIPFMAVDSPASLVGGRANWAIPKTLATFTGAPDSATAFAATGSQGPAWSVSATARARGPRLPVLSRARVTQEFPDGTLRGTRLKARGWMRLARVDVHVSSEADLPAWLVPGRHRGALITGTTFSLAEPRPC